MSKSLLLAGLRTIFPGIVRRYRQHMDGMNELRNQGQSQRIEIEKISAQLHQLQSVLDGVHQSVLHAEGSAKLRGEPWRCLFLVHSVETWTSLHDVWLAMVSDPRFEPVVATIPRQYPGSAILEGEEDTHQGLLHLGVPHLRLTAANAMDDLAFIRRLAPHMIFRQSPWEKDISSAFSAAQLSFTRLYYISYGIAPIVQHVVVMLDTLPLLRRCRKIFVVHETVKKLMPASLPVVVTGHPRVAYLQRAEPSWPIETGNRFKIIWSAHHSTETGWNDFGAFWQIYDTMLALAQFYPDVDFLFSPHPALLTRFNALSGDKKEKIDAFRQSWDTLSNTGLITNGNYAGPFKASDLLIVDGLSFLLEYQLNQKPVLFFERQDHTPFSIIGEEVKKGVHSISPDHTDDLMYWVKYFIAGGIDPLEDDQKKLVELLTTNKNPSAAILNAIADDMASPF
ncbi:hypothetical protein M975_2626 [Buttiauxella brennerae ATCC 51605]|uniref:Uncharacterized protein n=1 Tax=Buttiauxella brennerae ATCC 51605 TaxID=1354251 RepID=A0A1B7IMS4_9ENTR|nr:hypothetical protein [Buttiauxella brennerae]OAT30899.1 hypothetical protein M975_2626 [Buttiauxella brennerae ATCC 51605]